MAPPAVRIPERQTPLTLGHYLLSPTGLTVKGRPTFDEHEDVGRFIQNAQQASNFWLGDWLRYGSSREDWQDRVDQAVDNTRLSEKTLRNVRAVAAIAPSRRRDDVEFSIHAEIASLPDDQQSGWLEKAHRHGWTVRELRLELRAAKRRGIIEGQAVLSGIYRVLYADPPWIYGNRPPSGSGAQDHYDGMTVEQLCQLPVPAHVYQNAVLFMWVTAPMLPSAFPVIEAWGFTYKTNLVWDKVSHNFGNYVSVRHEHLLIATRGSCTPDRPTPMPDSVLTERQEGPHSTKPASARQMIERLYDGPRMELFSRARVDGWDCFGNDAALWHLDAAAQQEASHGEEAGLCSLGQGDPVGDRLEGREGGAGGGDRAPVDV